MNAPNLKIDWDDAAARAALAEKIGPEAYNAAFRQHLLDSTIEEVNGHPIRPVKTRYGTLYAITGTFLAFGQLEKARQAAMQIAPPLRAAA